MGKLTWISLRLILSMVFFSSAFAADLEPANDPSEAPLFLNFKKFGGKQVRISDVPDLLRVSPAEVPSLALASWVPTRQIPNPQCPSASPTWIAAYIVDVGRFTPQKLMQSWFPTAIKYEALGDESGFVLISADHEKGQGRELKTVLAVASDSDQVTPLIGRTSGLRVVFVAESSTESTKALESHLRQVLRAQVPAAKSQFANALNQPIVKTGTKFSPGVEKHLTKSSKEGRGEATLSLAYGLFLDSSGFVPGGQALLKQAAEQGSLSAKLEIIRLSKKSQLMAEVAPETVRNWQTELSQLGNSEARYLSTYETLVNHLDQPKAEHLRPLHVLGACGQPDARRHYAKSLMESFKPKTVLKGRYLVVDMMLRPSVTTSVPPLMRQIQTDWGAPRLEDLKKTALLRSACTAEEDPDPTLYVKKEDFSLRKAKRSLSAAAREEEIRKQIEVIDAKANAGGKAKVREALATACNWMGAEADREKLIVELKAREIGLGKWKRMRTCEYVIDEKTQAVCRDRAAKQMQLAHRIRMQKLKNEIQPAQHRELDSLERAATEFHQAVLKPALERAKWNELMEIEQLEAQLNQEFAALVGSTVTGKVQDEIRQVVTSRSLLIVPEASSGQLTIARKPATAGLLKLELEKLKAKMQETQTAIAEAALDDLSPRAKDGLKVAYLKWLTYIQEYKKFSRSFSAQSLEPEVWLYMQGVYFFEKIKDFELSRSKTLIQAQTESEDDVDDLNQVVDESLERQDRMPASDDDAIAD